MANNRLRSWQYWRDEWVYPFVLAVIFAMLIRTFIAQPFKIPSTSMYPTLKIGDRIFVNKFLYGAKIPFLNKSLPRIRDPKTGDIIVFVSVTDPEYPEPRVNHVRLLGPVFYDKERVRLKWYRPRFLVKRLIGVPGDTVGIKNGDLYINGKLLEDPLAIKGFKYFNAGEYGKEGKPITIPENSYFVMGDNSANSVDSRFWGFVPADQVTGKVFVIWWPIQRVRIIK